MSFTVIIQADTNDGDYITSEEILSENSEDGITRELVEKVAGAMNAVADAKREENTLPYFHYHNWPYGENSATNELDELYGDYLTADEIEEFCEYAPYGEYGIHTIESIRIIEILNDKELLD